MKNRLSTLLSVTFILVFLVSACASSNNTPVAEAGKKKVVIFVGLGTGTDPKQVEMQEALAKEFNASNANIEIEFMIVPYEEAGQRLLAMVAGDDAPQLVGPMGVGEVNGRLELWEDITPYIKKDNFDVSDFYGAAVELNKSQDKNAGLPLGLYPSFLFYNKDAFDAAGLAYPPSDFNDTSWTIDKLREDAMLLTLDKNNNNATSPDFDAKNISQWGYDDSWIDLRGWLAMWGAERVGNPLSADFKTAVVNSPEWIQGLQWYQDGIWKDHFIPDQAGQATIEATGADPFSSGMVAMWYSHTWYMSEGLEGLAFEYNLAPAPFNPKGTRISRIHADIFAIPKNAKNKDAAWEVMKWMTSAEHIVDVCKIYGCIPARKSVEATYLESMKERYPGLYYDVIFKSIDYLDNPNIESWAPARVGDILNNLQTIIYTDNSKDAKTLLDETNLEVQKAVDEYWASKQ